MTDILLWIWDAYKGNASLAEEAAVGLAAWLDVLTNQLTWSLVTGVVSS